ncbi:MAG: Jag N-terminal domain-containing protein [Clostridia bacterium]|nr:Jag N-terminal domain-containing protein [Clostridia bacterium]
MIKEIIATGKDVIEAQANARQLLGASELDDVQFDVIYIGRKGFMGFGSKPAQVRAYIEIPDKEEKRRRPERRKDRPERSEKRPEPVKESNEAKADGETVAAEPAAQQDAPKPKKKKNKKKPQANRQNEGGEQSKPKSQVIPECELKFERLDVGEGEDMSYDFIRTVILDIGLNATAELYSCDDGTRRITIKGEDASTLIGHHGDTLDALQYLANLASARKNIHGERDKSRVTLDIEGYRAKREETLRALARRMAAKALRNKRSVMLEPMSAYERRIIHSEIQGIEGVSTNSIGSDNNRKIVIFLTDKKPEGIFEEKKATPLAEEFAPIEDDVRIDDIDESVTAGNEDNETETVKQTFPDESETYAESIDDSDIK